MRCVSRGVCLCFTLCCYCCFGQIILKMMDAYKEKFLNFNSEAVFHDYGSITGTKTVGTSNRLTPVSKRSTEYREPTILF